MYIVHILIKKSTADFRSISADSFMDFGIKGDEANFYRSGDCFVSTENLSVDIYLEYR